MVFGVPPLVTFAVLVPYELGNEAPDATEPYITATTAFTMLSLFNVLRFPLVGAAAAAPPWPACLPACCQPVGCGHIPGAQLTPCPPPRFPPSLALPASVPPPPLQVVLPKALRCVSEALNATRKLEKFLAEESVPRQDTEGKPGGQISQVGGRAGGLGAGPGGLEGCAGAELAANWLPTARLPGWLAFTLPRLRTQETEPHVRCRCATVPPPPNCRCRPC